MGAALKLPKDSIVEKLLKEEQELIEKLREAMEPVRELEAKLLTARQMLALRTGKPYPASVPPHLRFVHRSVTECAIEELRAEGRPLSTEELVDRLISGGIAINKEDGVQLVKGGLTKALKKELVLIDGKYALPEWKRLLG